MKNLNAIAEKKMNKIKTLRDVESLVELAKKAFIERGMNKETLNENKIQKMALTLLEAPPNQYHFIKKEQGEIICFAFGFLNEGLFDDINYAVMPNSYIVPEHRGKGITAEIQKDFEQWAKEKKAKMISIFGFTHLSHAFEKRGYRAEETMFVKEIN